MSAQRPIIAPNTFKPVINAASMATSVTSLISVIQMLPGISYDVSWSGSPVGTFSVEVSNTVTFNEAGQIQNPGNWSVLPPSSFQGNYPVPSGTAGNGFLDIIGTEAFAIRLVYNATSGSGTLTAVAAAKVL